MYREQYVENMHTDVKGVKGWDNSNNDLFPISKLDISLSSKVDSLLDLVIAF